MIELTILRLLESIYIASTPIWKGTKLWIFLAIRFVSCFFNLVGSTPAKLQRGPVFYAQDQFKQINFQELEHGFLCTAWSFLLDGYICT